MDDVKHSEPEQIWLTTEQLGRRLGYSASNIRKMVASGTAPKARKMPGKGENTQYRFKMEDVLEWEARLDVVDNGAENAQRVQAAYERIQKRG